MPHFNGLFFFSFLFESASPEFSDNIGEFESIPDPQPQDIELPSPSISALSLVKQAEYMYSNQHHEEAYRLARHAYSIDPYDWRGIIIYVATMVNLGLKNELFYLGNISL